MAGEGVALSGSMLVHCWHGNHDPASLHCWRTALSLAECGTNFLIRPTLTFSQRTAQDLHAELSQLDQRNSDGRMHATMIRRVRTAAVSRSTTLCTQRIPGRTSQTISMATLSQSRPASSLPRVAQTSFWKSLVPKPFRRGADGTVPAADAMAKARKSKEWNLATFYIFIFLFIGSMSIQMISQKKDFDTFMRQSEVKIGLLREVVERIQKGEDVDVERILGTGDPAKEAEWEDGALLGPPFTLPFLPIFLLRTTSADGMQS